MRLFSQQEREDVVQGEEAEQKKRLTELTDAVNTGIQALNEFKEYNEKERDRINAEHSSFLEEKGNERKKLDREVSQLEERRRAAIEPLREREEALDKRTQELDTRESKIREKEAALVSKEHELDGLRSRYEKKLGELTDFDDALNQRERHLGERETLFEGMMHYKESVLQNERHRLRKYFEEERSKIDKKHG